MRKISHTEAAEQAQEILHAIDSGRYRAPSGKIVDVRGTLDRAVKGTTSYGPDRTPWLNISKKGSTEIAVVNSPTLAAARKLAKTGHDPVLLNFASATRPGGGFIRGALAQEEYLARSTLLYACLRDNSMYAFHRASSNPIYSDYVIYSPKVPVIRSDYGDLLDEPKYFAIISSPAVDASRLDRSKHHEIQDVMLRRIKKVLTVGLYHGHSSIVLGAWGCGAFGNDPITMARIFSRALQHKAGAAFERVVFAVYDETSNGHAITPFQKILS